MSKSATKFNVTLQKKFSFFKVTQGSNTDVVCSFYDEKFSMNDNERNGGFGRSIITCELIYALNDFFLFVLKSR